MSLAPPGGPIVPQTSSHSKHRILVTGGAGFIGWNLCRELRKLYGTGAHITVVDNLWTGKRRAEEHFDEFVESAIEDYFPEFNESVPFTHFDEVWHLASPASPNHYQSQPLRTIRGNVLGVIRALQLVKNCGMFFFTSTSEVYGDPIVSPQHEGYLGQVNCLGPRACYDESKRLSETIIMDWLREHSAAPGFSLRTKIVRLFNVYGPGTLPDDGRAVSNFITAMIDNKPIVVYGSGKQTRCFTYVDDVIAGMLRFAYHTPAYFVDPMNMGVDRETPVSEIALAVKTLGRELFGPDRDVPIHYGPPVVDDPQQRRPDLTLARKMIAWDPQTTYEQGLAKTIGYFAAVKDHNL